MTWELFLRDFLAVSPVILLLVIVWGFSVRKPKDPDMDDAELDATLTTRELELKYGDNDGEHPMHTKALWREAVEAEDTLFGYWRWVKREVWQTYTQGKDR